MGPNIFGKGSEYLEHVNDCTLENRSLFVNYCLQDAIDSLTWDMRSLTTVYKGDMRSLTFVGLLKDCKDVTARTHVFSFRSLPC